ncbi:NADPH:quinone oxidoreductase family protein [Oceanicella actignis]|uniref:NADPH2:quinone reductase n=1 Tax=Oceanicella actignis TaxID=1189325 RepID=A0A1M7THK3_9RHOB|nr:NADPH:quinone oxidoreductase family protein [Oceanicella actignis]SET59139.1 NADPH2:quinone reductase [Oceanicella actignis]SHN70088.1 NADPH2:quinone reductase [Oceanicella actignis]
MRAVICSEFGPPEKLAVQEVPVPEPGKGQVRIRVEGCGVNFPDTLIIEGKYQLRAEPPFSPGGEVAGVVDAVGEGVSGWSPGDPVIAMTGYGGFAEQILAPAAALMRRPESMDGVTAAGFSMTYGTSMHALKQRGRLQPGETLLVLGAGGGVGLAAVEIGKLMGAKVIAAASSEEKLEAARAAGADELLDYSDGEIKDKLKKLTGGNGVDVTYDPVGGDLFEQALRATAWKGRVLVIGFASGTIPKVPMNLPLLKGCDIVGVFWGAFRMREPEEDQRNFEQLFAWHAEGKLKPRVSHVLPLEQAPEALRMLMNRQAIGKIVLKP